MSDLDRTLTTLLGEELARESDRIPPPPPLADLRGRAARHRRRRWGAAAVSAAAAAAVAVAAVQLWPGGSGSGGPVGPAGPDLPQDAETFDVPSYDWDGSGMDALVSGRLGFTPEGCPLIYQQGQPESAQPVVFPDAVGVRLANGVRAVVHEETGRVFAVEGQEFSYGGGWVPDGGVWTGRCGSWDGEVAWINDEPDGDPLTEDPAPPEEPAPTRVATDEERGLYAVPTFEWDPAQGGDGALLEGTVTMTADGCATVRQEGRAIGIVLPNATGMKGDWPGGAAIMAGFPDGSETVMAHEGLEVSYGGGFVDAAAGDDWGWGRLCPGSPVDELFLVQDR